MEIFNDNYSKGCQSCQDGKWLCIYLTYLCPANCTFCPSPFKDDRIITAFGNNKEIILDYLSQNDFNGIGFSGGDPFIRFSRLLDWLYFFKKELPCFYFWAYTSGVTITKKQIEIIANYGLDELRFNIDAINYKPEFIEKIISYAVEKIPNITVEIPSIAENSERLIKVLPLIDQIGVKYLNLHEHIFVKDEQLNNETKEFFLNKRVPVKYSALSLENTYTINQFCKAENLKIKINNCNLEKKEEQMRMRRLTMGKIFKLKRDLLDNEGIICRDYFIPEELDLNKLKNEIPDLKISMIEEAVGENKFSISTSKKITLKLIPPLTIEDDFYIIDIQE